MGAFSGAINAIIKDPKIRAAVKELSAPTPAVAPAATVSAGSSGGLLGGGSGVAYPIVGRQIPGAAPDVLPTAAQGSGLPPASAGGLPPPASGAIPTPGMTAGPSFAKPTTFNPFRRGSGYGGPQPGSLGDLFKNMMMQRFERPPSNRVDEYNRPTPVNPSDQYFNPTDLLRGSSPFGNRQDDGSNTTISKFLGSGPSGRGGIADLLRAFGG